MYIVQPRLAGPNFELKTDSEDAVDMLRKKLKSTLKISNNFYIFVQVHELDLSSVVPSLSGPKRPHDR